MAETTIAVDEDVREALEEFRHHDHDSLSEVLETFMRCLPETKTYGDGCDFCDEDPWIDAPLEEVGGVSWWYSMEYDDDTIYGNQYFCSPECAKKAEEEQERWVPENPDRVVVGGDEELRTEFADASFYIDGTRKEVGIPVPGAFAGTNSHDREYDYIGEPVYVENKGDWVQSGVIESIIHEEAHTALILGSDYETEQLNHPDEERREKYKENHVEND